MSQPKPSRQAGLKRLHAFLPNSGRRYANSRNSDHGPNDRSNVSMLSGHLRHRLLLETEVLDAVMNKFAPSTAEKFIQEVFWRGYFKGWLEHHPTVWTCYRDDVARLVAALEEDPNLADRYEQATSAQTGIACFDAWSRELMATGYLHNHTRMWFASIWIFTLQLPWQLGADLFYRHLTDGDPASNTLSWRWVGGLHTKGKTYLARATNIEKYTAGRFAPHGELTTSAPPLSEETPHPRQPLRSVKQVAGSEKHALLITEEDGLSETLCDQLQPAAGVALLATEVRSPLPVGARAIAFAENAMRDSTLRASEHFGISFPDPSEADDWGSSLAEFACANGVKSFVTAYAPVGPVAEKLERARRDLADHGISLCEVRRPYEDLTWPHATRGFFALKKKIPDILEQVKRAVAPRLL
ncbi:MAG: FAD-binding domain-containing protein [Hyphomicrobiaceae bacterium]